MGMPIFFPATPASIPVTMSGTGTSTVPGSARSYPDIAAITNAESTTLRLSGPTWSRDHDSDATPTREARPKVGLRPTVPHSAAGIRMDPPVSLPRATCTTALATAAPEPPLDPPGVRSGAQGLPVVGVVAP